MHYVRDGVDRFQRAAMVAVAGYSIETPAAAAELGLRPLPGRLGNDFDQVGAT